MRELVLTILETMPRLMKTLMADLDVSGIPHLNRTQMKTLTLLYHQNGVHMTRMCHHLNIQKGSFTPIADTLIHDGFIERRRDPNDRRRYDLVLTEKGRAQAEKILHLLSVQISAKLQRLNEKDYKTFLRAVNDLHTIAGKLEETNAAEQ